MNSCISRALVSQQRILIGHNQLWNCFTGQLSLDNKTYVVMRGKHRYDSGGSRGGVWPPLFWVKNEKKNRARKKSWEGKQQQQQQNNSPPPQSLLKVWIPNCTHGSLCKQCLYHLINIPICHNVHTYTTSPDQVSQYNVKFSARYIGWSKWTSPSTTNKVSTGIFFSKQQK